MKKILLLSIFSLGYIFNSFAQTTSNFVVFSEDASLFYVIVNGIKQNVEPQSNVKITGLTNPNNQVTIVFANEKLGSLKKNIWFQEMGVEATAKITKTKKGLKLRYFGEVPISSAPATPNAWTTTYSTSEPTSNTTTTTNNTNSTFTNNSTNETTNNGTTSNTTWNINSSSNTTNNTTSSSTTNTTTNNPFETSNSSSSNSNSNNSNSNNAVEMNYNWIAGQAYQFAAVQTDDVSTSMMGMSMKDQFKTTTNFTLYIASVDANGVASGILYLTNYNVVDSKNTTLASIKDIPSKAIQSEVKVDRKGKFTFMKKIMLITTEKGNVLAYAKADGNSMTLGGQAGDMQVDAYAEFDPKTGNLKAGYTVKEIKTTKKVTVKVTEETDMIDVLPYDYLELLALPDGGIAQGDKTVMNTGIYNIDVTATSVTNGIASLNYKMSTDKSKDMFSSDVKSTDGNGNSMFDMNTNEMNMGDIEMTAEDKNAMDMMKSMSPSMTCDITSDFNYFMGMFNQVYGTVNTSMDAMGMKLEVKSFLQLKKM